MLPLITQPVVAPACYKPRAGSVITQAQTFRGGQYLARTPAAGNRQRWTMRLVIHRDGTASDQRLLSVMDSTGNYNHFLIDTDRLGFQQANGGGMTYNGFGTALHRDYAGWMDVVLSVDTTTGTVVITVNGQAETLSVSANTLAGLNTWINSAQQHAIGVNELALNSATLLATIPMIARRIGQTALFRPMPLSDAQAMVTALCEVEVKPCLVEFMHRAAAGKSSEIKEGIAAIERFGKRNANAAIGVAEMAGQMLFNDRATGKPIIVRV